MSSLTKDFHTVCIDCRGVYCDLDHRCMELHDTDDSIITEYVRHKLTLHRKMLSKHKLKVLKLSDIFDVVDDLAHKEAVCRDAPLSVEPPLTVDLPSISDPKVDSRMDEKLSTMHANIFSQFSSMFTDFSKQLECKFSKIDDSFDILGNSQINSVSTSQETIDVSQHVSNVSFSAPTSVALLTGHTLAKASYAPQQGGLEIPLARVAAEDAPLGGFFPSPC